MGAQLLGLAGSIAVLKAIEVRFLWCVGHQAASTVVDSLVWWCSVVVLCCRSTFLKCGTGCAYLQEVYGLRRLRLLSATASAGKRRAAVVRSDVWLCFRRPATTPGTCCGCGRRARAGTWASATAGWRRCGCGASTTSAAAASRWRMRPGSLCQVSKLSARWCR